MAEKTDKEKIKDLEDALAVLTVRVGVIEGMLQLKSQQMKIVATATGLEWKEKG